MKLSEYERTLVVSMLEMYNKSFRPYTALSGMNKCSQRGSRVSTEKRSACLGCTHSCLGV
jgi:hypothetical protein